MVGVWIAYSDSSSLFTCLFGNVCKLYSRGWAMGESERVQHPPDGGLEGLEPQVCPASVPWLPRHRRHRIPWVHVSTHEGRLLFLGFQDYVHCYKGRLFFYPQNHHNLKIYVNIFCLSLQVLREVFLCIYQVMFCKMKWSSFLPTPFLVS